MFSIRSKSLSMFALLLAVATSFISASRIVHAHGDGAHAHHHPLVQTNVCDFSPSSWHAHVHFFGIDIHLPVDDENNDDPRQAPGDEKPQWTTAPLCFEHVITLASAPLEISFLLPPLESVATSLVDLNRLRAAPCLTAHAARVRLVSLTR